MWGRTGKTIVGISVIAFVLILITGVWMWSYSARRNLRRSLSLTKPDVVRGLHVGLGVYATLFLLVMALTGIAWSFPVLFRTFAKWSGDGFTFFHIWHDLHTGAWGGVAARAVWFLAALVGASLPVTGYWLWARRLVLQRRSRQRL